MSVPLSTQCTSIGRGRPAPPEETPLQALEGEAYGISCELVRYRGASDARRLHVERWARHDGRERAAQAALLGAIRERDWSKVERIARVLIIEDAAEDAAVRDQIACALRGDDCVDRAHRASKALAAAIERAEGWLRKALRS